MVDADDDHNEYLKSGQKAFRQKQYVSAIASFQKALENSPNHLKALRGLAASYAQSNQTEEAIQQYKKLTQVDLTNGVAWLNLGAIYISQENYKEAVKAVRSGMMKEKRSAIGYYYLGEAHIGLNQSSMAMTAFKEAIKLDPEMINAHIGLANYYLSMKSHAQAIKYFEQAVKVKPDSQRAQNGLKEARQHKENNRDAINPFGRLVDMDNMGLKGNVVMNRDLSEEEKIDDRQMVRELASELLEETEKCLGKIHGEIEPSLLTVFRTLAEGGTSPANVLSSIKGLQDAIKSVNDQRKEMRNKVMLLRAHEEIVNAPEFGGGFGSGPST